jgi:ABC-type antimicrobial peptide transport system permease subunit
VLAGLAVALGAGGLAGVYPAVKAARLAPAEALRVT